MATTLEAARAIDTRPVEHHNFRDLTAQEWVRLTAHGRQRIVEDAGVEALDLLKMQRNAAKTLFGINHYDHALQSASRALRAGESEEWVVAALLHDLFEWMNPYNHDRMAGDLLRYVLSDELAWIAGNHQVFQLSFRTHSAFDLQACEKFRGHPYFENALRFCERYDQNCFDPHYDNLPLETFEPMVRRLFADAMARFHEKHPYPGVR
jgi:predicted HD phosphohydrolase